MFKSLCLASLIVSSSSALGAFDTTPPTNGAIDTGNYRNVLSETGRLPEDIKTEVDEAFNKMFYGNDEEVLYNVLDNNEAYIDTVDSSDVRSEGMSWGMTIAVMMDKQSEFNKLWRFTYDRMRNDSGQFPGTYAWQVRVNDNNTVDVLDPGSAPDGELYLAFALFNASARWGNGSGVNNYEKHANDILVALKTHLMDRDTKQILFSPLATGFTDPSYHVPAFYDYFAKVANRDNSYWTDAAQASRTFLRNHFRQTSFGLASYLAEFSGEPKSRNLPNGLTKPGDIYEEDAWRVAMNVGVDAHLSGHQAWHKDATTDLLTFFQSEGFTSGGVCGNGYSLRYNLDGTDYGRCNVNNWRHDVGQTATNAVATLAITNSRLANTFVDQLWNANWPTGLYRYYHGSLYMLGMLHLSGNFKLYYPESSSDNNNTGSSNSGSRNRITTIKAFKDAYIRGGSFADTQYGTSTGLAVKKSGNLTFERRAVMAFDRSSIGNNGNRTIVKATLRIRTKSANSTATSASAGVFGISNRWQETGRNGVTFNRLSETGSRAATFSPARAGQWKSIDITDYIKNDTSKTRSVFMIRNIGGDAKSNWEIYSRESSSDPELIIEWR